MEEGHDTIQAKKRAIHDDTHIWGKTNPTFGGGRVEDAMHSLVLPAPNHKVFQSGRLIDKCHVRIVRIVHRQRSELRFLSIVIDLLPKSLCSSGVVTTHDSMGQ